LTRYIVIFLGTDRARERVGQDEQFDASTVGLRPVEQGRGAGGQEEHR